MNHDQRDVPKRNDIAAEKRTLRRWAHDARKSQRNAGDTSRLATARLIALPEYQAATTILWYVDCRNELRTRDAIAIQLKRDVRVVVPYCTVDQAGTPMLGLWQLQSLEELEKGKWSILEPPKSRWCESARVVRPVELDLVVAPGVAFDRLAGRLGNGYGYYDRLFPHLRPDCVRVGLCFDSQVFNQVPTDVHDWPMHYVVTQSQTIEGDWFLGS